MFYVTWWVDIIMLVDSYSGQEERERTNFCRESNSGTVTGSPVHHTLSHSSQTKAEFDSRQKLVLSLSSWPEYESTNIMIYKNTVEYKCVRLQLH